MIQDKDYIDIERNLQGKMSPEETREFLSRLDANEELKTLYDSTKAMNDYLDQKKKHEKAIESIKTVGQEYKLDSKNRSKNRRLFIRAMLGAAAVGLVFVFSTLFFQSDGGWEEFSIAEVYHEPYWPVERGPGVDEKLSDAMDALTMNDYSRASQLLLESDLEESEKRYWLAELYIKAENPDKALDYISTDQDDKKRRDRMHYLEIMAYLQKEDYKKVETLIESLPSDTDAWYWENVYDKLPN